MSATQLDTAERFHPRVEAGFMVKLLLNGRAVLARVHDLSMNGLFVQTELRDEVKRVTVALPLPGDREVVATCLVKRVEDDGAALEFEQLDWDDMFALARFLHPRLP